MMMAHSMLNKKEGKVNQDDKEGSLGEVWFGGGMKTVVSCVPV